MKLIINPAAGRGKARKVLPKVKNILDSYGIKYSCSITTKPAEATSLARDAVKKGFKKIIVLGGDGTVNEVINGIIGANVVLGVIPIGSGNDFCMGLGIPGKTKDACRVIIGKYAKRIDVGKLNDRYFGSSAGIGLDAETAYEAGKNNKLTGLLLYVYSLIKTLIRAKPHFYRISVDDKKFDFKGWIVAIGNCPSYGGGIKITPDAKVDDDIFDICLIGDIAKWRVLYYLPVVVIGKHKVFKNVQFLRGKRINIETASLKAHLDGEIITSSNFKFEIIPKSLNVLIP